MGDEQADRYLDEIGDAIMRLRQTPGLGVALDLVRSGYRRYPTGAHRIYFYVENRRIEIVRVLHARMEVEGRIGS